MKIKNPFKNLLKKKVNKKNEKLLKMYEDGIILQVGKDIDNKQYISEKIKNGHYK